MCGASVPSSLASGHFRDVRKLDTNMCLCECAHALGHVIKSEANPVSQIGADPFNLSHVLTHLDDQGSKSL